MPAAYVPHRFLLSAVERVMAVFWNWVWEPMLFVTIGSSIDFSTLDRGIIPKSLIIICTGKGGVHAWQAATILQLSYPLLLLWVVLTKATDCRFAGVCLRTIVTFLIMSGFGYSAREKLFYALAWTPKATVQAALSGAHPPIPTSFLPCTETLIYSKRLPLVLFPAHLLTLLSHTTLQVLHFR